MNPATGPHGTPRKAPAVTAETTEDRLRRGSADDSDDDDEEDLDELNERYGELGEVYGALEHVDATLFRRFYDTRGLVSLNSHFRAALQRTVKMHHQRHKQYEDVMHRLDEYRSHVDRRRRDLGYESPHDDG